MSKDSVIGEPSILLAGKVGYKALGDL